MSGSVGHVAGRGAVFFDVSLLGELAVAGVAGAATWAIYQRCYVAVPPNRALVLFGRRSGRAARREDPSASHVVARAPRVLIGGGTVLAPWNKAFAYLSLAPIDVEATVRAVHSIEGGSAAGWEVALAVQAKVATEPEALRAAAQELFGMAPAELAAFVRRAVEASVPLVLAKLGVGDAEPDWDRLGSEIQATVAPELIPSGLVVRSVAVRELRRIAPLAGGGPGDERGRGVAGPALSARGNEEIDVRLRRIEVGLRTIGSRVERLSRDGAETPFEGFGLSEPGGGTSAGDGPLDDSIQEGRSARARPAPVAARGRAAGEPPTVSDAELRR